MGKSFKFLLVTLNCLILLMGLILLGIGIFAYVDGQDFNKLVDTAMKAANLDLTIGLYGGTALLIIAVSSIIVIVSFLGCCGAWKENRCLLFFNYVSILLLFIGVVAGTTIAFTQSIDIIRNPMLESMQQYQKDPEVTESWDSIQEQLKCCGVDKYSDWANTSVFPTPETNFKVPKSCCMGQEDEETCMTHPENVLTGVEGCFTLLKETIDNSKYYISIGATTLVIFMFANLLAIFSYVACLSSHRNYQTLA